MKCHLAEFWPGWGSLFWNKRLHWDWRLLGIHQRLHVRCIMGCHTLLPRYPGSIGSGIAWGLVGSLAYFFCFFNTLGCICAYG